jgi:hypothetical protein
LVLIYIKVLLFCNFPTMAFLLVRFIRRKYAENKAKTAPSTNDESHLMPEATQGESKYEMTNSIQNGHEAGNRHSATSGNFNSLTAEEAARQKEESRKRNIHQWKLLLGLALPNFLASVDVTIVAPAIPLISSHFSMLPHTIITSYHTNARLQTISQATSTGSLPHIL